MHTNTHANTSTHTNTNSRTHITQTRMHTYTQIHTNRNIHTHKYIPYIYKHTTLNCLFRKECLIKICIFDFSRKYFDFLPPNSFIYSDISPYAYCAPNLGCEKSLTPSKRRGRRRKIHCLFRPFLFCLLL